MKTFVKSRVDVPVVDDPAELSAELARARELEAAHRSNELERDRARAGHDRDRADVAVENRLADLRRTEREADVRADAELARMYREYRAAGERTRIQSEMARSGEARALRLKHLRERNLWYLVPLLLGFGAWSTTGVQQSAARLMNVDSGDPVWWALWGLEALLIGVVCRIIVVRARLASSGGELASSAERIGVGCLTTSIFLNLVAAVPADGAHVSGWWAVPGAMLAHAIGPVGAALTAHLIGVFDKSIAAADPWHETRGTGENAVLVPVPRLSEMDLQAPKSTATTASEGASESTSETASESASEVLPATVWPVPRGDRPALTIVALPVAESASESTSADVVESGAETASESTERIGADLPEQQVSEAPAEAPVKTPQKRPQKRSEARVNKGVKVPAAARKSSSIARRSDEELVEEYVALVDAEQLTEDSSTRQVQNAIGIGFERAKRVRELYGERLAEMDSAVVQALPEPQEPTAEMTTRPGLAVVGGDR